MNPTLLCYTLAASTCILSALAAQQQSPLHVVNGASAGDRSGWSLSAAGDVTGSGTNEYLIGNLFTGGGTLAGSVQVVDASGNVLRTLPGAAADRFGNSVTGMGLWTTDARADFAVGATQGGTSAFVPRPQGYVELYRGAATPAGIAPVVRIWAGIVPALQNSMSFGKSIDGGAEFQGDGVPDLVVGAHFFGNGSGRVWVYTGAVLRNSTGTLSHDTGAHVQTSVDNLIDGTDALGSYFGHSVCALPDLTGDGRDEIAVGAPHYGSWNGKVYVYAPNANGTLTRIYTSTGVSGSRYGYAIASAGDANGDGFADLVVGAPDAASPSNGNVGSATVLSGRFIANGTGPEVISRSFGDDPYGPGAPQPNDSDYGAAVAGVSDLNGDGNADVLVGGPAANAFGPDIDPAINFWPTGVATGGLTVGTVRLVSGDDGATLREWFGPFGQSSVFGWAVAGAGDLNGDGTNDLLFGAPLANASAGLTEAWSGAYTFGRAYGTALPHSSGVAASIGATGSHSVSGNQLRLTCSQLPTNQFGIFFYGFAPSPGGPVWITGPFTRIPQPLNSGPRGAVSLSVDVPSLPAMFGTRVYFQYWTRDGATTAFSDAIDIGFIR